MSAAAVCPVVGTTTNVLPPNHPPVSKDSSDARCPVTNAKVEHHQEIVEHPHPSASAIPDDVSAQDASACPALKNANNKESLTDATCPVVGPVNAHLPPQHPSLSSLQTDAVCPATKATLEHHKGKLAEHVPVAENAPAQKCPVAGAALS